MKYRKNIYFTKYLCLAVLLLNLSNPAWAKDIENSTQNSDHYEYYNRKVFAFNNMVDKALIRPLTVIYSEFVPKLITTRISSFLSLWSYPMDVVNYAIQGEWDKSKTALVKFTVSIILTAGTSDAGEYIEDPAYQATSMNATFASLGFGAGPYIVLPLLGSGSTRDMVSRGVSAPFSAPFTNNRNWLEITFIKALDIRSKYLGADKTLEKTSLDYYSTYRTITLESESQFINGTSDKPVGLDRDDFDGDDSDDDLDW